MKCYIDQSGKVENTSKLTVVAYANGKAKILLISSKEKRKLITILKRLDYPNKVYIYKIFAGLVFLLVRGERPVEMVIDNEYPGYGPLIKDIVLKLYIRYKLEKPSIDFESIGKNNLAHKVAIEAYRGKTKADLKVKAEDVLRLFYAK